MISRFFQTDFDEGTTPNKFTVGMGKLIRQARLEANLKQTELAGLIYRRQAAVSDMENGKQEVTASTLLLLSYALNKPVHYFFPRQEGIVALTEDDLDAAEQEMLLHTRRLRYYAGDTAKAEMARLLVLVRAWADFEEESAVAAARPGTDS